LILGLIVLFLIFTGCIIYDSVLFSIITAQIAALGPIAAALLVTKKVVFSNFFPDLILMF
jgi:hypothetical protein